MNVVVALLEHWRAKHWRYVLDYNGARWALNHLVERLNGVPA
jgi:hypothetical protein